MADIEQFIRELNTAWMSHRYDELYSYFHDRVVISSYTPCMSQLD